MLKYKSESYETGRAPISSDILVQVFQEVLKNESIEVEPEVARRIIQYFLASVSYYFYNNPEFFVDFKKMVLYRDSKLQNLITLEAKDGENAETIKQYLSSGGAFSEELISMVDSFVKNMLNYSTKKEKEVTSDIERIKKLTKS